MPDRLDLVASILAGLHYDAVGVGETDLRTSGDDFFKKTAANKLTVLDASSQPHESTMPYLVKTVGGTRVGIASFGSLPYGTQTNEYARRKALYTAYKAAREGSDILIVLDQASLIDKDWIERNEKRLGAPDVVVGGIARQYPDGEQTIGKTHIVPTSMQGKHVGVVDVELSPGQEPKFTLQRIGLEADVAEDAAVAARIKEFTAARAQQVPTYSPPQGQKGPVAGVRKPYYHPQLCMACHAGQYKDWQATKHAQAVADLTKQQQMVPECLKCHSEMYRTLNRVASAPQQAAGIECATCHSGSLPHGLERKSITTRVKVDPTICMECHNKQWSPNYEEKSYMAKVSHIGAQNVATTPPPSPPASAAPPLAVVRPSSPPPARERPPMPPPPPDRPQTIK